MAKTKNKQGEEMNIVNVIKIVSVIVSIMIACGGAIYAMDDRYVDEEQAATSLQNFNAAVQKDLVNIELQILTNQKESLVNQYNQQYQLHKQNPDDEFFKEELIRIRDRIKTIDMKIDSKLSVHSDK